MIYTTQLLHPSHIFFKVRMEIANSIYGPSSRRSEGLWNRSCTHKGRRGTAIPSDGWRKLVVALLPNILSRLVHVARQRVAYPERLPGAPRGREHSGKQCAHQSSQQTQKTRKSDKYNRMSKIKPKYKSLLDSLGLSEASSPVGNFASAGKQNKEKKLDGGGTVYIIFITSCI